MDELILGDLPPWSEADQLRLDIRNGDAALIIEGASRKFGLLFFGALGAAFFLRFARLPPSDPLWRSVRGRRPLVWPIEFYAIAVPLALYSLRAAVSLALGWREPWLIIDERGAHRLKFLLPWQRWTQGWDAFELRVAADQRAFTIDRGHVDHTFRRCRIVRPQA